MILIYIVTYQYYGYTYTECARGGEFVRIYLIGMIVLLNVILVLCGALVNRSAQGSITDVQARRHVAPILKIKIFLILPEFGLNVVGTAWAFSDYISCNKENNHFTVTVIECKYFYLFCCIYPVYVIQKVNKPIKKIILIASSAEFEIALALS